MNKPHIVIDARLYGPRHTGLGRYTKNLLVALIDQKEFVNYRFTLLVYPELATEVKADLGDNFDYVVTNIRHYSISEQLFLPGLLRSLQPSIVHFTHLDKPILYFGTSVITIHDLIRHFSRGADTTTRSPWLYWPKYWGYLLMTWFIIRFNYVIVPSDFWRDYIISKFEIDPSKIITTYEAVDPVLLTSLSKDPPRDNLVKNYLLYTGNLYPHKNIKVIFEALRSLPDLQLKIICARDLFQKRSADLAKKLNVTSQVQFLGYVPDKEFQQIYSQALALVHPALLEGFSLTGLEAMALSCPVIAADSSCLPEIYQKSVLYFNPTNPDSLVKQISSLRHSPSLRQKLILLGRRQVVKYSWAKTASQTLSFYATLTK